MDFFKKRPPIPNLKLQSRVSKEEWDAVQKLADKYCGGNTSLWIRVAALNFRPLTIKNSSEKIKKRNQGDSSTDGTAPSFKEALMSENLDAAFERAKRCSSCQFEPCVCVSRTPKFALGEPQSLREAIEKALCSESPLKALAVEMEVSNYLRRKTLALSAKDVSGGIKRSQDLELLEKLLGMK